MQTLLIITFLLVAVIQIAKRLRPAVTHRWRRRQARILCTELCGCDRGQPAVLVYARLRVMDPLAFEELLLEAFRRRGQTIVRNRRYTGDGGVDGQVMIGGACWLIQAKRYRATIRREHVEAFARVCGDLRMPGLFINTGRTGGASRKILSDCTHIEIISGERLLALLRGVPLLIGTRTI